MGYTPEAVIGAEVRGKKRKTVYFTFKWKGYSSEGNTEETVATQPPMCTLLYKYLDANPHLLSFGHVRSWFLCSQHFHRGLKKPRKRKPKSKRKSTAERRVTKRDARRERLKEVAKRRRLVKGVVDDRAQAQNVKELVGAIKDGTANDLSDFLDDGDSIHSDSEISDYEAVVCKVAKKRRIREDTP